MQGFELTVIYTKALFSFYTDRQKKWVTLFHFFEILKSGKIYYKLTILNKPQEKKKEQEQQDR